MELFQSQGCSSCPPANANVGALGERPGVLALSFAVTYWDRLGWRDTFAKREFPLKRPLFAGTMATLMIPSGLTFFPAYHNAAP